MGQIFSACWKPGDGTKGLPRPKTSKICKEPNSQSHIARPYDVQLAINTSRVYESAGEGTKATAVGPTQNGLPDLLPELFLMVAAYLPPSSLMSLSYSCSRIYNKLSLSIEDLLGEREQLAQLPRNALVSRIPKWTINDRGYFQWSVPTIAQNLHHTERLNLLSMLDRDGKLPPSKAVCSGCADTHDRSLFSTESLAQSSYERRCLGSAGRLWICPHWILDHNLITTSSRPQGSHWCGKKMVTVMAFDHEFAESTILWWVAAFRGSDKAPSKKLVEDILSRTDVNVCKHLRLSDDFVSSLYSPDCKKLWINDLSSPCDCSTCAQQPQPTTIEEYRDSPRGGKCESCGTNVHFNISKNREGEKALKLVIRRKIAEFRGCTDRAWIEQVNDPRECEELERKWHKATDQRVKVLPYV